MKIASNSTHNRQKTQKNTERQKTTFPKESVENADFFKHILNKIMTRHKKCVKYNFVAPVKFSMDFIMRSLKELRNCNQKIFLCPPQK